MTDVDEEVTEFTFDQLSDSAKGKARESRREHALDYDWWDCIYDDAVCMGALIGFEIGNHTYAVQRGNKPSVMFSKPDIWFSGFSCQGDGCCWSGVIVADKLNGAVERIKGETSDEDLHSLAARCEELFSMIAAIAVENRFTGVHELMDWPDIELTMRISISGDARHYSTRTERPDVPFEIENFADSLVADFASWIYDQLEAEHDYRLSDESIDGEIDSDTLFDEDGNEL